MKIFRSVALFSLLTLGSGFALEPEISDLEKELLSLEHEFLDTLEENFPAEVSSEELPISLEMEEPSTAPFAISEETTPPKEIALEEITTPSIFAHPYEEKVQVKTQTVEISFSQVFSSSPFIYSLLFGMSFTSIAICLYIILRIRQQSSICDQFAKQVRDKFLEHNSQEVSSFCSKHPNWLSNIVLSGLNGKKYGLNVVLENMKTEGKRATIPAWQQLGILQDIAIISPMLGLLGTVIGLFYAFYDLNRSMNSISNLLDGLGISVGTTVAGIGVAILSMMLHSMTKFRLVRSLAKIETEANSLAYLIDKDS